MIDQLTLPALETRLAEARLGLVRLCARLTGEASAAEDLAQETLLEAWRSLAKLHDPDGLVPWLNAIARNVCLRWARMRGRELALSALYLSDDIATTDPYQLPAADPELSLDLERGELAALLDRALALLPAETRAALVGSYVSELPGPELAALLGLTEGALRVRLHRGRLALKRALASDLREDASALGLVLPEGSADTGWRETRIWCPFCGQHHVLARIDPIAGEYSFKCSGTCVPSTVLVGIGSLRTNAGTLTSAKSILARHCLTLAKEYRQMLLDGGAVCPDCGDWLPIHQWTPDAPPPSEWASAINLYGIYRWCPRCHGSDAATPLHMTLDTEEAQRFWRKHPRMRLLPVHEVEAEGRTALVTGFESVDATARLVLVSARDTYEILRVHEEGRGA